MRRGHGSCCAGWNWPGKAPVGNAAVLAEARPVDDSRQCRICKTLRCLQVSEQIEVAATVGAGGVEFGFRNGAGWSVPGDVEVVTTRRLPNRCRLAQSLTIRLSLPTME